jgi:hypothetical protein
MICEPLRRLSRVWVQINNVSSTSRFHEGKSIENHTVKADVVVRQTVMSTQDAQRKTMCKNTL